MSEAVNYIIQNDEAEIFTHAANNQLPVLIKGPTGCGKTRFIEYMAQKLQRPLITVACHDDLTATDLVGRHLINNEGTFWQDGPLTQAVRQGGICYLDEVVEARKDTTVVLHPLADYRRELNIERTGEKLKAHPQFMLVMSYNPGYQNVIKGLKPSTRQRFVAMSFDYPSATEESQVLQAESGVDSGVAERLVALATAIRQLQSHDLEDAASTRLLIYTAVLIKSGLSPAQACQACLGEPLTEDQQTLAAIQRLIGDYFP